MIDKERMEQEEKRYRDIVKKYKDFIYTRVTTMTEAEFWRAKYYGEI